MARDSDLLNMAYPESLQDVDDLIDHSQIDSDMSGEEFLDVMN